MTKTTMKRKEDVLREWHVVDASGKILGRTATEVAQLLIGKHKSDYTPHVNMGDKVIVTNSAKIQVTGNKLRDKVYKHSTQYPGSVKEERLEELMERDSNEVIRRAVKRMLPKNKLQKQRLANLYIYRGEDHPHENIKK